MFPQLGEDVGNIKADGNSTLPRQLQRDDEVDMCSNSHTRTHTYTQILPDRQAEWVGFETRRRLALPPQDSLSEKSVEMTIGTPA